MAERTKKTNTQKGTTASELAARHAHAQRRGLPRETETRQRKEKKSGGVRQLASARPFWRALILCVLGMLLITVAVTAFRSLTRSELFAVKHIDLEGNKRTSREDLLATLQEDAHGGLWRLDLDQIRNKLKRNPWVREVEVTRALPDRLKVKISEREPWLLARRNDNSIVWIDHDGTVLGDESRFNVSHVPPLVSGLAEGAAPQVMEKRRRHLELVQQLLTALDERDPKLSPRIDEVILDDVNGIKLRVSDGRVTVTVGTQDFYARTQEALKVLDAVAQRDVAALRVLKLTDAERLLSGPPIAYINATLSDRVVVGLATQ
jgi:cell division septal protein FtsQ